MREWVDRLSFLLCNHLRLISGLLITLYIRMYHWPNYINFYCLWLIQLLSITIPSFDSFPTFLVPPSPLFLFDLGFDYLFNPNRVQHYPFPFILAFSPQDTNQPPKNHPRATPLLFLLNCFLSILWDWKKKWQKTRTPHKLNPQTLRPIETVPSNSYPLKS